MVGKEGVRSIKTLAEVKETLRRHRLERERKYEEELAERQEKDVTVFGVICYACRTTIIARMRQPKTARVEQMLIGESDNGVPETRGLPPRPVLEGYHCPKCGLEYNCDVIARRIERAKSEGA